MAAAIYLLCVLTSTLCAVALIREYRRRGTRLLLWSSVAFVAFAINNALVVIDFIVLPAVDLSPLRAASACVAVTLLLVGLVWEAD